MILVVGSTGLLGKEICLRLRDAGRDVRAVVRDGSNPGAVQALQAAGVETVIADLKDPDSLGRACRDAAAVVSTASSTLSRLAGDSIETVDLLGHRNLIAAAQQSGVRRMVYVSIPADFRYACPLVSAKREIEATLSRSGLEYTVLQPNYFMEVWLGPALGFDFRNGRVTVYGAGDRPLAWVSYRDVAGFAVDALAGDAARNRVLPVGGPDHLTPNEVVRIFEAASGRSYEVTRVPEEALQSQYATAADPLAKTFAALMLEYARGCPMDCAETRARTSVREYAERSVA